MPITWIAEDDDSTPFPPTRLALPAGSQAPGLLAGGARLSTQRLEAAYRQGIFPWFSPGQPVLWWSPDPRMVLPVAQFKLSRSLRKTLQQFRQTPGCTVRMDSAFEQVIKACAQSPRQGQAGTWIVPAMQQAYAAWHRAGHVHSVETWIDGELVGGLYCVNIGRMVFGESMFARRTDASKIALAALVAFCRAHGVTWIDCQQNTQHLASLGATEVSRHAFEGHLAPALEGPDLAPWFYHDGYWAQLLSTAD